MPIKAPVFMANPTSVDTVLTVLPPPAPAFTAPAPMVLEESLPAVITAFQLPAALMISTALQATRAI
jgi:hypothetical protein